MKERTEVKNLMIKFFNMVKTQFGKQVKVVQSDNGTEFLSGVMTEYYGENGILYRISNVDSPNKMEGWNANIDTF